MKVHLRFALLASSATGLCASTFSQELINIQVIEGSCDSLYAQVSVFFPFGAGNTCPSLSGFAVMPGDATAVVDLYYDISGAWPHLGCTTTTNIAIPLPANDPLVQLSTLNIMDGDTSLVITDTLIQVCITGTGNDLHTEGAPSLFVQGDYLVFSSLPPHQNALLGFFNTSGNLVHLAQLTSERLFIGALPAGVYVVRSEHPMKTAILRFARP